MAIVSDDLTGFQRMLALTAASLLCLMMSQAHADPGGRKIVGLGATSCSQFSKDTNENPSLQRDYLAWAQGFMSGILLSRPPAVDLGLDLNPPEFSLLKQLEFLRDYCGQRPSEDFSDAVAALYKRLRKQNAT